MSAFLNSLHNYTLQVLRRSVDGDLAKALCCQCFIESTSNVSYVDDRVGQLKSQCDSASG